MTRRRSSRECREAGDTRTLGAKDEAQAARSEFHLARCSDCREDERIVEGYRQTVLSADDRLDDVAKARVGARLGDAVERASVKASRPTRAWRRRGVQLAAAALVVAVLVGVALWRAERRVGDAPERQPALAGVDRNRVLLPRAIVEGSGNWPKPKLIFGQKVARLEVPAGVGLRASLAQRAALTLYGPLSLAVTNVDAAKDLIEITLQRGTLIGEYEGSDGSTLRIHSPRATTEIVGTLFAVEVHDGETRVSVSRGRVRVESAGKKAKVASKQSFSTARSRLDAIPPSVVALFAKHERLPELARVDPPESKEERGQHPDEGRSREPREPAAAPRRLRRAPAETSEVKPQAPRQPSSTSSAAHGEADKPSVSGSVPKEQAKDEQPETQPATALYSAFESALKQRDEKKAGQILSTLIKAHPGHALSDQARYELALLLLKRGERHGANTLLSQIGSTRFAAPAHYLRCRIKRELGQPKKAITCYGAFRVAHPSSPHAYQALVTAMRLAAAQKDCKTVLKLTGEYLSDHEFGKHVDEARRLKARCER